MSPLKITLLICLLLGTCGRSEAVKLFFSPTLLKVSTDRSSTTSTQVTNQDSEPVEFTAEVFRWTQKDGEEVLTPSRDTLVSPQKFVVLPGRSQTVRVAIRLRDESTDTAYRLILTALPKPSKANPASSAGPITNSVTTNYAFRIPVFVTNGKTQSNLTFDLSQDKTTLLGIVNSGNGVAILSNITVTLDGVRKVLGNTYVLPLTRKDVTIAGAAPGIRQATVSYDENGENRSREVELGRR